MSRASDSACVHRLPLPKRSTLTIDADPALTGTEVRSRALTSALTLGARSFAVRGVSLLGFLALARIMTREEIGAIAVGTSILVFGNFLVNAGLGIALIREREEPSRRDLAAVSALQLGVAGVVFLIALAVSPLLGIAGPVTALMLGSLMFSAVKVPGIVMLERRLRYRPILLADIGEAASFVIVSVALALAGWGPTGVGLAALARGAVGALTITLLSPVGFVLPRPSLARVRAMVGFGANVQGVSLVVMARDQSLNLAAATISGLVTLSIWSVAYRFMLVPGLVYESLGRLMLPALSRLHTLDEDLRPTLQRATQRMAVLTGVAVSGLAGTAPALIPLLIGDRWTEVARVLPVLSATLVVASPVAVVGVGYLYAIGEARPVLLANLWSGATGVAVGITLLPFLGAQALALAAVTNATVEAVLVSRLVARRCGVQLLRALPVPVVAAAASGAAGYAASEHLGPNIVSLSLALVCSTAGYAMILGLLHRAALVDTTRTFLRAVIGVRPAARA